jgi:hypothetical protein
MAVGNPFGLPLFNRLGIGAPQIRAGSPLSSVEPNYDGFARGFDGVNGPPSNPMADVVFQSTLGPQASLTALNQMTAQQGQGTMSRVPRPDPFQGRPVPLPNPGRNPLQTMEVPPGLRPSVVITGNERLQEAAAPDRSQIVANMTPDERVDYAQSQLTNRRAKSPEELALYDSILNGTYTAPSSSQPPTLTGFSGNLAITGEGFFPLPPPVNNPLNPNRPSFNRPNLGGGLSNVAFPTLAPSNTNTFTGGLFGAFNNAMNNNPMNGGGVGGNQPLSQQIPQAVQQAVTPLLQNTASQLNQGIGSMVNQRLVGS